MKVTIKDVAKRAGVSVATVSRAVNGVPNLNEEMRQRVESAIRELGYKPNQLAKGLKNHVTNTLGFIAGDIADPFIIGVARAVERVVRAEGYTILMASTDNDEEKEKECIDMMVSKCVDGLIICSGLSDVAGKLKYISCPVVSFDRNVLNHICDTVYVDKEKSMYDAVTYLLKRGHTDIALISGDKKLSTNFDRYNGYMKAFFENGQAAKSENFLFGQFSREYGKEAFESLMARKNPPTAVVSGSAMLTQGILEKARQLQVRIPEDISLVAFGTLEFQSLIEPKITYAGEMQNEIGSCVGEMMLARLKDAKTAPRLQIFESRIIEGNSVKNIQKEEVV